jgi:hypothetical protein
VVEDAGAVKDEEECGEAAGDNVTGGGGEVLNEVGSVGGE